MSTALILISIQSTYFKGGSHPLKGTKRSAKAAAKLLWHFRQKKLPVFHVLYSAPQQEEPATAARAEAHELVAPAAEETVIYTASANAFAEEKLIGELQALGVKELVIAGFTADHQVNATVRAATEKGFACTLIQDACVANSFLFEGNHLKADLVLQVFLASLYHTYAEVCTAKEFLKREEKKERKKYKKSRNSSTETGKKTKAANLLA
ncbi:isochorismatase family protein [Cesiribacter sp. SM1]|uniref:isochorismatase family protein n=1 Tax=Cesiribacter sp. SM1 TaxID=2861196 RepID=UPI001CD5D368|nr:isochorismatase family protein [Cesiribacter sp. SM1]